MSEWILGISAQIKIKAENNKSVITTNEKIDADNFINLSIFSQTHIFTRLFEVKLFESELHFINIVNTNTKTN